MIKIEKAIYGMAADFSAVFFERGETGTTFFRVDPAKVKFAKDIAFTLNHEPKKTITTLLGKENGELIIVQKGECLFFKFIPTTRAGQRLYRYVKAVKYRQCSYIYNVEKRVIDAEMEERFSWSLEPHEHIFLDEAIIFEVCLTNTPRDKLTFCTTDANHPQLKGIDWTTNVQFTEQDCWKESLERATRLEELPREMADLQQQMKNLINEMEELNNGYSKSN